MIWLDDPRYIPHHSYLAFLAGWKLERYNNYYTSLVWNWGKGRYSMTSIEDCFYHKYRTHQ